MDQAKLGNPILTRPENIHTQPDQKVIGSPKPVQQKKLVSRVDLSWSDNLNGLQIHSGRL